MSKPSIWTIEGRLDRIGIRVSSARLDKLKDKRDRQLTRLIEKYKKLFPKKCRRWESRIAC